MRGERRKKKRKKGGKGPAATILAVVHTSGGGAVGERVEEARTAAAGFHPSGNGKMDIRNIHVRFDANPISASIIYINQILVALVLIYRQG